MIAIGTRVRVVTDPRRYIRGRTGTVSTCPAGILDGVVVDIDTEWGGVDPDWHLDEAALEVLT